MCTWSRVSGILLGVLLLAGTAAVPGPPGAESVTFLVTSDSHYASFRNADRNDRNRATLERMNALPGTPWPEQLGGGTIDRPRGYWPSAT